MRILIAGGPRTGKTQLAGQLAQRHGIVPRHTDDLIGKRSWSEASADAAEWMSERGPFVIEGVAVARALRKWLAANPDGAPADVLYLGIEAKTELTPGQRTMTRGCESVWSEIAAELERRGLHPIAF